MIDPTYEVLMKHPDLTDDDLEAYLADSIRSEAMLALTTDQHIYGPFYRGRSTAEPELRLLTSYVITAPIARQFGKYVHTAQSLHLIAVVAHTDFSGQWVEYIGWPED